MSEAPVTFWSWIQPQIAPLLTVIVAASAVIAGQINAARTARTNAEIAKASADKREGMLSEITVNTNGKITKMLEKIDRLEAAIVALHKAAGIAQVKSDADDETIKDLKNEGIL